MNLGVRLGLLSLTHRGPKEPSLPRPALGFRAKPGFRSEVFSSPRLVRVGRSCALGPIILVQHLSVPHAAARGRVHTPRSCAWFLGLTRLGPGGLPKLVQLSCPVQAECTNRDNAVKGSGALPSGLL